MSELFDVAKRSCGLSF